jgi:hypothetical protein
LRYLHLSHSLASEEGLAIVAREARRTRAQLIVFDSLTLGSGGASLSDQNAWNRILMGMEAWGVPVVCIDHMGKDAAKGAVGSFMKQARVRSMLTFSLLSGRIKVEHVKSNFGPLQSPFLVAAQRIGPDLSPTCVRYEPLMNDKAPDPITTEEAPIAGDSTTPVPVPLARQTPLPPPDPAELTRRRALDALHPLLSGEGDGWVSTGRLVKALVEADPPIVQRTPAYNLLAAFAQEGRLERQLGPTGGARAYRLPPAEAGDATAPPASGSG